MLNRIAIYKAKEGGRMLRLLKLAKKHLFPKAHATAAIKCERGTVKDPPLEITALFPFDRTLRFVSRSH